MHSVFLNLHLWTFSHHHFSFYDWAVQSCFHYLLTTCGSSQLQSAAQLASKHITIQLPLACSYWPNKVGLTPYDVCFQTATVPYPHLQTQADSAAAQAHQPILPPYLADRMAFVLPWTALWKELLSPLYTPFSLFVSLGLSELCPWKQVSATCGNKVGCLEVSKKNQVKSR